eukprot:2111834-Rhodomonas_salina.1
MEGSEGKLLRWLGIVEVCKKSSRQLCQPAHKCRETPTQQTQVELTCPIVQASASKVCVLHVVGIRSECCDQNRQNNWQRCHWVNLCPHTVLQFCLVSRTSRRWRGKAPELGPEASIDSM